ncbi:hypothetical protein BMB17_005682, partial [Escherichia coli]|nr:hypothetical protein [Escherichia coli]
MTTMDYGRPASFRIGRVIGDSFGVFGRNFLVCIGLALIFSGLPTVLYQWWILGAVGSAYDPAMPETASMSAALLPIIGALISFALGAILQAGLTRAAIEDLNGEKPTFGDCLSTALAVLLPALGIAILTTLGISIGFMLLIVPGVILLLRWAVSIPVLVNERLGVLGSMSRSAELTKGNRWQLLGLYVILLIIIIGLQLVLGVAL